MIDYLNKLNNFCTILKNIATIVTDGKCLILINNIINSISYPIKPFIDNKREYGKKKFKFK